jgi:hypothetical protein
MNEVLLIIWLAIWLILLIMSTFEKRGFVFGFVAGVWILLLGVYILGDGLQLQSGMTILGDVGDQTIEYVYTEVVPPYSSYSLMWGIPFIALGMYICYLSATSKNKQRRTERII